MKILTYEEVLVIKKAVDTQFGLYLHFHEGCGSQYFSFDAPADKTVQDWLKAYFGEQKISVTFTPSGAEFTLQ